jgi:hypothetical protein
MTQLQCFQDGSKCDARPGFSHQILVDGQDAACPFCNLLNPQIPADPSRAENSPEAIERYLLDKEETNNAGTKNNPWLLDSSPIRSPTTAQRTPQASRRQDSLSVHSTPRQLQQSPLPNRPARSSMIIPRGSNSTIPRAEPELFGGRGIAENHRQESIRRAPDNARTQYKPVKVFSITADVYWSLNENQPFDQEESRWAVKNLGIALWDLIRCVSNANQA